MNATQTETVVTKPEWEQCYESFPERKRDGTKTGVIFYASFKLDHEGNEFRAVRFQSSYGWATYEVYKNGVLISAKYGSSLPRVADLLRVWG